MACVICASGLAWTDPELTTTFGEFHSERKPLTFVRDKCTFTYEMDHKPTEV